MANEQERALMVMTVVEAQENPMERGARGGDSPHECRAGRVVLLGSAV